MSGKIRTIILASAGNPQEMKTWSGIPAHISVALRDSGVDVIPCGPLKAKEPSYYRWLRSSYWHLGRGWFLAEVEPRILKQRSVALRGLLAEGAAEAVLCIQPDALAAAAPAVTTALVHDSTFALLLDYYQPFTGLSQRSIRLGHHAYYQALEHASVAIYSSAWAARSAVRDYGADPAKVHVVEFGANLQNPPRKEDVARFVESRLSASEFRFLFIGVDWKRKGGDDAVLVVKELRRMGVRASLDIVGCRMQGDADAREFCFEYGYLDKGKSGDREQLRGLFEAASFLLVPSRAECFGCVYCEANAYGIPSIGRDTGGVSQAIRPGVNGFLLSAHAQGVAELAEQLMPYLLEPDKYRKLAISSRIEYEERLNWNRFVEKTLRLLELARE